MRHVGCCAVGAEGGDESRLSAMTRSQTLAILGCKKYENGPTLQAATRRTDMSLLPSIEHFKIDLGPQKAYRRRCRRRRPLAQWRKYGIY
jgi:hypothetical protein